MNTPFQITAIKDCANKLQERIDFEVNEYGNGAIRIDYTNFGGGIPSVTVSQYKITFSSGEYTPKFLEVLNLIEYQMKNYRSNGFVDIGALVNDGFLVWQDEKLVNP